jgi:vanillate/3-O-methylgallate O-demethylase
MSANTGGLPPYQNLKEALETVGSPVELLRESSLSFDFPVVPDEYTNWRDEQRAWRETCGLWSMSHHMTDLYLEGPDALDLLSALGVNDFDGFEVNQAKQFIACNPDGYLIGDAVLSYLDDERFNLVGTPVVPNWVQYHAETGEYDVSAEREPNSTIREGPPSIFRYQIQGPNALDVMEAVTDEPLPDVSFFDIGEFVIAGREIRGLVHGMAGEPGYELFGPWEHSDEIWDAIVEAGQAHGLARVGSKAFPTSPLESGWLPFPLPAIYENDEMDGYRRWLGARNLEVMGTLGGSFVSEDVTDYYMRPDEVGYGPFVDFDHNFVGRDALAARTDDPGRTKVTLVWDDRDTTDVFGTLFRDGETAKYLDIPQLRYSAFQYDAVLKDGETVGVSKDCAYTYNERTVLSLAVVDSEYNDPGTGLTLLWGEQRDDSPNPAVERHAQTEIDVTVAPAPYVEKRLG